MRADCELLHDAGCVIGYCVLAVLSHAVHSATGNALQDKLNEVRMQSENAVMLLPGR